MLNPKSVFLYKLSFLFLMILALGGCASMQKPQGGPRDLTPPKLLKAEPENMTRNFSAKQITLEFDEFFKLTNQYQEITISPAQDKSPEYKTSKKKLIIDFKDSLQKNTTYVINFGKSIADVNESNVMKNFTYVFSTGPHIDSLSITGNVMNTTTQEKEKEATVFLFPISQDSLLFGKKKPTIYTTTDSAGNFSLNNLREDTYRIYALKEPSPDKIFNNDNDLIAFLKKPIKVDKDTSNIQLKLFKQVPEKFRLTEKKFTNDGKLFFLFNRKLEYPLVKVLYPTSLDNQKIVDISKTKDTAQIYFRNMDFDSVSVAVYDGKKALDTVYQLKKKNESFERTLTFSYNTNRDNKLRPATDLYILANMPIQSMEPSQIILTEDSAAVTNYTLQKDTANTMKYNLKYRWRANSKYVLTINDDAFVDIYGDKNKKAIKAFTADKPENYSQLTLKVTLPADSGKAYVVELLDEQKKLLRSDIVTKTTSIVYHNYITGKYRFRVIYDDNKNGKWDSGNVRLRQQPENIWLSPKEVTLRANWEAEEPLEIPKETSIP
jgi:hypothetical protein